MRRFMIWCIFAGFNFRTGWCWVTEGPSFTEPFTKLPVECGGNLTEPSGRISSPGFDGGNNYPAATDCLWALIGEEGQTFVLEFLSISIEESGTCSYDYVEVFDPISHLGRYCGYTPPAPITSSLHIMVVVFSSDSSVTDVGFEAEYRVEEGSGKKLCGIFGGEKKIGSFGPSTSEWDDLYENNYICTWRILAPTNPARTIQLYITQMDIPSNENCEQDYVEVLDTDNSLGVFCGTVQSPVLNATSGLMEINFITDETTRGRGFSAYYLIVDSDFMCGEILTQETGTIESVDRDLDGEYDTNVDCVWLIIAPYDQVVKLKFKSFQLEADACSYDWVSASEDIRNPTEPDFGPFCGDDRPVFRSMYNLLIVIFHSDRMYSFEGFEAQYTLQSEGEMMSEVMSTVTVAREASSIGGSSEQFTVATVETTTHGGPSDCGSNRTNSFGRITSPGFKSGSYPVSIDCFWAIISEDGKGTVLEFLVFDVELHEFCIYDFLEVFENTGFVHGKFCGTELPNTIVSFTNVLILHFHSDTGVTHKGFKAEYSPKETVDQPACGILGDTAVGHFGPTEIDNEGYYANDYTCSWIITAPNAMKVVQLYIYDLDIPSDDNCEQDYLQVNDFNLTVGIYCGNEQPPLITSDKSRLTLIFVTDSAVTGRGFQAHFNVLDKDEMCGGTLTSRSGTIHPTDRDSNGRYDNNLDCYWSIVAPGNRLIHLQITNVVIEIEQGYCLGDGLKVYDGAISSETNIGTICGTDEKEFWSSSNIIYLHFYSDESVNFVGFDAAYTTYLAVPTTRPPPSSTLPWTTSTVSTMKMKRSTMRTSTAIQRTMPDVSMDSTKLSTTVGDKLTSTQKITHVVTSDSSSSMAVTTAETEHTTEDEISTDKQEGSSILTDVHEKQSSTSAIETSVEQSSQVPTSTHKMATSPWQSTVSEVETQTESTSVAKTSTVPDVDSTALTEQSTEPEMPTTTEQEHGKSPTTSKTTTSKDKLSERTNETSTETGTQSTQAQTGKRSSLKPDYATPTYTYYGTFSTYEPSKANLIAEFSFFALIVSSIVTILF